MEEYLEKLWECYQKGIKVEHLPKKDLFIELIRDLIKQIETRPTLPIRKVRECPNDKCLDGQVDKVKIDPLDNDTFVDQVDCDICNGTRKITEPVYDGEYVIEQRTFYNPKTFFHKEFFVITLKPELREWRLEQP